MRFFGKPQNDGFLLVMQSVSEASHSPPFVLSPKLFKLVGDNTNKGKRGKDSRLKLK